MWMRCAERIGAAWISVAYNRQYEPPHSWIVDRRSDCGENAVRNRLSGRWQLIDARRSMIVDRPRRGRSVIVRQDRSAKARSAGQRAVCWSAGGGVLAQLDDWPARGSGRPLPFFSGDAGTGKPLCTTQSPVDAGDPRPTSGRRSVREIERLLLPVAAIDPAHVPHQRRQLSVIQEGAIRRHRTRCRRMKNLTAPGRC
jgi:hypothetical protein